MEWSHQFTSSQASNTVESRNKPFFFLAQWTCFSNMASICILGILHMRYEFHGCCQQNLYHHLIPPNWVSCVLSNLQCGINFWHCLNCWHFCNTRGIVGCCTAAKPQYPLPKSAVAGQHSDAFIFHSLWIEVLKESNGFKWWIHAKYPWNHPTSLCKRS